MNDLRTIRKLNNQSLRGVEFGVGEPVLILPAGGQAYEATVTVNNPDDRYLTAGGITFDKDLGESRGEKYPVSIESLSKLAPKRQPQSLRNDYIRGKHISGSNLASRQGHA